MVLTDVQNDFLATVTTFNIRARYDDYKLAFYKTCTKEFADKWLMKLRYLENGSKKSI